MVSANHSHTDCQLHSPDTHLQYSTLLTKKRRSILGEWGHMQNYVFLGISEEFFEAVSAPRWFLQIMLLTNDFSALHALITMRLSALHCLSKKPQRKGEVLSGSHEKGD